MQATAARGHRDLSTRALFTHTRGKGAADDDEQRAEGCGVGSKGQ